jgi:hypothetical protein
MRIRKSMDTMVPLSFVFAIFAGMLIVLTSDLPGYASGGENSINTTLPANSSVLLTTYFLVSA